MIRLSIHLLKNMDSLSDAIEKEYQPKIQKVNLENCEEAIFVYKEPQDSAPDWYPYIAPIKPKLPDTLTSPSALLIIKTQKNIFSISFGFGRYILNLNKVISDFGLKVCLNTIPSNKIKTLDKTNLEQMGFHTRQQAVIPMDFNTFNIEIERDLLKSVEGHLDTGIASYLKGSTSLTISTDKDVSQLAKLCMELKKIYSKDTYKNEFGWIDNIKLVKDADLITDLDNQLSEQLSKENFDGIFLGAPEIIDDEKVGFYQFVRLRNTSKYSIFPTIEQYIAQRKNCDWIKTSFIEATQNHRLEAFDRDKKNPGRVYSWTIYNCLHAETSYKKNTYKLLNGDWYEVAADFIDDIDATINSISHTKLALPSMNIGETEGAYNKRTATHLNAACLDCDLVRIQGRSPFEFCDIFTDKSHVIHVKKYSGASAMSHLLYQALVSGQLYNQSAAIRKEIAKKKTVQTMKVGHVADPKVFSANDYEIVIAVATQKNKPLKNILSFFSKVSLAHKYKVLKGLGYKVTIAKIQIT